MRGKALCLWAAAALAVSAGCAHGEVRTKRISGTEWVSLPDAAEALGMKEARAAGGGYALSGGAHRAEIPADGREVSVDGLRVFLGDPTMERGGVLYVSRTDFECCLSPRLRPGLGSEPPPRPKVIALDPGHGGSDTGATNARLGVVEKTCTLEVALKAQKLLEAAGFRVVLTRRRDEYVGLDERPEIARKAGADLFVSIHFNALESDSRTRGSEVFVFAPSGQTSTDSWSVVNAAGRRENDAISGALPGNRFDRWSPVLALAVHRELLERLRTDDRGEKIGHLAVLKTLACPGILIEPGFVSNNAEARRIADPAFQQRIAEAILAGIQAYADELGSVPSKEREPGRPRRP
jgi:N-acetylmuramoyl-L-alanine amidase